MRIEVLTRAQALKLDEEEAAQRVEQKAAAREQRLTELALWELRGGYPKAGPPPFSRPTKYSNEKD